MPAASQPPATASEAIDLIRSKIAQGLTPVMAGTSFYRHSFRPSQFGSYVYYLDERGTAGAFQARNVERVLDFVDLGQPVAGSLPDMEIVSAPRGRTGMAVAVVPGRSAPTLLEAAEAALRVMPRGPERDDLEMAVLAERRIN